MKKSIHKKSEKGQALVLIVLAIVGLIGITGLTIDGGFAYSDRRNAQNAADTAALAAGRMFIRTEGSDSVKWIAAEPAGMYLAESNGYNNNESTNFVDVYKPPIEGVYEDNPDYIQVIITSHYQTSFARVVGITQMTNRVLAVARVIPTTTVNMFDGNAMIAINTSDCSAFTVQGSTATTVTGSGIFVNSDCDGNGNQAAYFSQSGAASMSASSLCAVGAIDGNFIGPQQEGCPQYTDPQSMYNIPTPSCPSSAVKTGSTLSAGSYSGTFPPNGVTTLQPGVYCVSGEFRLNNSDNLTGSNVIIYMINGDVSWQGGTVNLSAPTSGPFQGMLIYMPWDNTGDITINGNVDLTLSGTVLAPASNVQINGSAGSTIDGQVIGDTIDLSGGSNVAINYDANLNYEAETPPYLELTQ